MKIRELIESENISCSEELIIRDYISAAVKEVLPQLTETMVILAQPKVNWPEYIIANYICNLDMSEPDARAIFNFALRLCRLRTFE